MHLLTNAHGRHVPQTPHGHTDGLAIGLARPRGTSLLPVWPCSRLWLGHDLSFMHPRAIAVMLCQTRRHTPLRCTAQREHNLGITIL